MHALREGVLSVGPAQTEGFGYILLFSGSVRAWFGQVDRPLRQKGFARETFSGAARFLGLGFMQEEPWVRELKG